jgi:hypothetical protein
MGKALPTGFWGAIEMPNIFDQIDPSSGNHAETPNMFDRIDPRDAIAQPDPNAPGLLETFGRGVADGATFGYSDKLGFDKDRNAESAKANPWTHFLGEAVGTIGPSVAATLAAPEVVIPAAAAKVAPWLKTGYAAARSAFVPGEIGTLGQAVAQGAKLGASYGALSGSGHADVKDTDSWSDALEKRGTGALVGGAEGLIAGPLFGAVGHGLYRGAQALGGVKAQAAAETAGNGQGALNTMVKGFERDRITPQQLIDQIRSEFPDDTQAAGGLSKRFWGGLQNKQPITSSQVEETVRRAMAGESAADISAALSAGGSGPGPAAVQTLLDELAQRHLGPLNIMDRASLVRTGSGDNTQMTMRAAAATPGDAKSIARENLLERQIGSGGRLQDLFGRLVGSPDYDAVAAKHAKDLEAAGAKAYGLAFANEKPFDLAPIFDKWFSQRGGKRGPVPEGVQEAIESMMTNEPVKNPITGMSIGVNPRPPQNLQEFIDARQNVRQMIDDAKPGTPLYNNLSNFYKEITNEVARKNPDWNSANQLWRDGSAATEAMEAGANMATRLNARSRENLSVFTDASNRAKAAAVEMRKASKQLKGAKTPAQQTQAQALVDAAQARIDAANVEQELFKVGLVRALNDQAVQNSGETHNLTRTLLLPGAKQIISTVLKNDAPQFLKAVQAEAAMHRTYSSQFGAQTTPLREAIDELNWAPKVDASLLNPMHWPTKVLDLATEYAARNINAKRNSELMGHYTNMDPMAQLDILNQAQKLHAVRSNWGNAAGRPVVSATAPAVNAYIGEQQAAQHQPLRGGIGPMYDENANPIIKPYQP